MRPSQIDKKTITYDNANREHLQILIAFVKIQKHLISYAYIAS